ncbi:MAG: FAD-dependent oxidoreductase [Actinomycetota bacterium]
MGTGVAGLGAAWALSRVHDVTVFESGDYLGGHAHTVDIEDGQRTIPVDTGFIVYNEANYPNLVQLFHALDVPTEPSDMSFSVSRGGGSFEYQARALGIFAQPSNLFRRSYRTMVREIFRFTKEAKALVGTETDVSTEEWLARRGFSDALRDDFLLPMVACIWSSSLDEMRSYPAATMAAFLDNHGLLDVLQRPAWRTVSGGSREYVRRVAASFDDVRLATPIASIVRLSDGVIVRDANGHQERFDHVVLATHADTSLAILGDDASSQERSLLGAFGYSENRAVLHRDPALMPVRHRAWSSWNYLADGGPDETSRLVSLTYWMNRLQNLETEHPVLVTLNPIREPERIVAEYTYHHPAFDRAAVDAQRRLPSIQGVDRTWFAGSYCGYGFHEDGLTAGLGVAASLGAPAPWWGAPARPSAALVRTGGSSASW